MKTLIMLLYWPVVATLIALLSVWLFRRGVRRGWILLEYAVCLFVALICLPRLAFHLHIHGAVVRADFLNVDGWREDILMALLWMISYLLFGLLQIKLAPGLLRKKMKKAVSAPQVGGE